jgi:hypothetical protein
LFDHHFPAIAGFFLDLHLVDEIESSFADCLNALLEPLDNRGSQGQEVAPEHVLFAQGVPGGSGLGRPGACSGRFLVGRVGCHAGSPSLATPGAGRAPHHSVCASVLQFFSPWAFVSRLTFKGRLARGTIGLVDS